MEHDGAGTPGTSRTVSAWLGGLDGGTWWARDDREPHLAASTMKLPVAVAALRAHAAGAQCWVVGSKR